MPENEILKISKYCAKMIFICSLIFLFLIKIRFPKGVSISEKLDSALCVAWCSAICCLMQRYMLPDAALYVAWCSAICCLMQRYTLPDAALGCMLLRYVRQDGAGVLLFWHWFSGNCGCHGNGVHEAAL